MNRDIVIEEIREARHRISQRFNHDTSALLEHYRELEKKRQHRVLSEQNEQAGVGVTRESARR